jgi:hypothetical protein
MRQVYFLDNTGQYHAIPWTGATGPMPCFTDRHVTALNRIRRQSGLRPRHDRELAEILIYDVLMVHEPTSAWQTVPKKVLNERSRTDRNADMARRDREGVEPSLVKIRAPEPVAGDEAKERTGTVMEIGAAAVARARAERRADATADTVAPARRLGAKHTGLYGDLAALSDEQAT